MIRSLCRLLVFAAALPCVPDVARAQASFLGSVLDDSSRTPLKRYPVALVRFLPRGESVVARRATDTQGLFQLFTDKPGVYQLEFGDTLIGITYGPVDTVTADTVLLRQYAIPAPRDLPRRVLLEYHVDEPVIQERRTRVWYPADRLDRGICGEVLVRFVVDTSGRAEMETFRVIRSSDSLFSRAVREGVAKSKYKPARLHGRAVRQLVSQPFVFDIREPTGEPSPFFPKRDSLPPVPYVPHPSCAVRQYAR